MRGLAARHLCPARPRRCPARPRRPGLRAGRQQLREHLWGALWRLPRAVRRLLRIVQAGLHRRGLPPALRRPVLGLPRRLHDDPRPLRHRALRAVVERGLPGGSLPARPRGGLRGPVRRGPALHGGLRGDLRPVAILRLPRGLPLPARPHAGRLRRELRPALSRSGQAFDLRDRVPGRPRLRAAEYLPGGLRAGLLHVLPPVSLRWLTGPARWLGSRSAQALAATIKIYSRRRRRRSPRRQDAPRRRCDSVPCRPRMHSRPLPWLPAGCLGPQRHGSEPAPPASRR